MEGVLVTARRDRASIAITVVSDSSGHYKFPADRLAPGHCRRAIRAAGYDLAGPDSGVHSLMPGKTNIRRVFFDNATNSFWIDANHHRQILEVEALN